MRVTKNYILVDSQFIPDTLTRWFIRSNLDIAYIRQTLKELLALRKANYDRKKYPKSPNAIPSELVYYVLHKTQSKAEIAILLFMAHRYMSKGGYARFKLQELSECCGISRIKLSKGVSSLVSKQLITKEKLHPNYTIANGSKYSFNLLNLKDALSKKVTSKGAKKVTSTPEKGDIYCTIELTIDSDELYNLDDSKTDDGWNQNDDSELGRIVEDYDA